MTITYQRLAAVRPANTDEQDLYVLTNELISGMVHVCNQDSEKRTYRIAVTDTGAGVAANGADFIRYDLILYPNIMHRIRVEGLNGIATVRIKASVADLISFVFFGALKV
jgi:phosphoserine aminotransferase